MSLPETLSNLILLKKINEYGRGTVIDTGSVFQAVYHLVYRVFL